MLERALYNGKSDHTSESAIESTSGRFQRKDCRDVLTENRSERQRSLASGAIEEREQSDLACVRPTAGRPFLSMVHRRRRDLGRRRIKDPASRRLRARAERSHRAPGQDPRRKRQACPNGLLSSGRRGLVHGSATQLRPRIRSRHHLNATLRHGISPPIRQRGDSRFSKSTPRKFRTTLKRDLRKRVVAQPDRSIR